MRKQISLLWGTMLYERSIVEFKLGVALFGTSAWMSQWRSLRWLELRQLDIGVMVKSHCSSDNTVEGILQSWICFAFLMLI